MPHRNLLEIGFNPHNLDLTSKKNYESIFLVQFRVSSLFHQLFYAFHLLPPVLVPPSHGGSECVERQQAVH